MFENLFRKGTTLIPAPTTETDKSPALSPDGAPPLIDAGSASVVSAGEIQGWRNRICASASDDAGLLQLAHEAPTRDLKLAALQALTHENSFRQAMHAFRERDKRLYRTAKSRWQAARAKREATAEANALIAAAKALLDQELIPANRMVDLDRAWAAVNSELLDAALPVEFAELRAQLGAKARARGEGGQALTRWLIAADNAIGKLSASLAGVAEGGIPPTESETLAASLLELLSSVQDAGDTRCVAKTDAANRVLALASSVVQRATFLQSLPAPGVADEANEKLRVEEWRGFPEGPQGELHTVLAYRFADWRNAVTHERQRVRDARHSHQRERKVEHNRPRASAIQREVEAAEAAHAAGHIADMTRLMTAIDQMLKRGPANTALTQRIESLRREQLRLQDWQRWGGGQCREQLAAEAQELARMATGKVAIKAHAEAIGKLRERWKELDRLGGASNQSVWLAFDGALNAAYAPVAAHLERLKLARNENLARRNQLVDALVQAAAKFFPADREGGTPAPGVKSDWRAIAHTLEEARIAWRKLGPVEHTVPRKALRGNNAVTAQYAAAVQALEAPLNNAHGEARRQREQLITAAKDLGGSELAARDVVDKVRRVQTQWQAVAKAMPLPQRDESRLWSTFKTATDAIFAARDAARAARDAESSNQVKAREEIIERLVALSLTTSAQAIKHAMAKAGAAWRTCTEVARPQAARLDARYRAARDAATKRLGELAAHASQARFDALIAKMALCHEREVTQDSDRAITDEQGSDLEARWNAVENLPEAWNVKMEARFRAVGLSRTGPPSGSQPDSKSRKDSGEGLHDTLLNLEVACGIESPAEFLAARQHLRIRALKSAMESRQTTVAMPADIERWLLDAAATPRPDKVSRDRLAKVIAAVRLRRPAECDTPTYAASPRQAAGTTRRSLVGRARRQG